MTRAFWAVATATVIFSGAALAVEPTDMDGTKTKNGQIIREYFKMRFEECKTEEADKKYYHAKAIEHGWLGNGGGVPGANAAAGMAGGAPPAGAAPGGEGMGMGMPAGGKCEPIADIKKLIVQGDLVFVQAQGHQSKPNGDLLWILYRMKDGKIIEHWDTHDAIPDAQVGKQW